MATKSIKDIIKAHGAEAEGKIAPYRESFKEALTEVNSKVKEWTDDSVTNEFGAFIYKALGNVNGSINMKPVKADSNHYYGWGSRPITGIVTARKFGFRLAGKINNYYMDEKDLLPGLCESHIELVKRPSQRQLVRDFYTFKKAYYGNYIKLYNDLHGKTFEVDIPIKAGMVFKVNATCNPTVEATIVDEITDGKITKVAFELPHATWIDEDNVTTAKLEAKRAVHRQYGLRRDEITVKMEGTVNGKENKFPNLDLPLLNSNDINNSFFTKWFEPDYYSTGYKLFSMGDVINSDAIKELINKFLIFNKGTAKSFEYLRLKYAKNLILNGVF